MRVFLSYHFDPNDETFVHEVYYFLRKQPGLDCFDWSQQGMGDDYRAEIAEKIEKSEAMIIFGSKETGRTQRQEISLYGAKPEQRRILVQLAADVPPELKLEMALIDPIRIVRSDSRDASETRKSAVECAKAIIRRLGLTWLPDDGIPLGYPFAYEKDIIEEYIKGNGRASRDKIAEGCPSTWPSVEHLPTWYLNPLDPDEIGKFTDNTRIIVDSRLRTSESVPNLPLLEARPREKLRYPLEDTDPRMLGVGILVSGGIAPGINAVIDGIVKRHTLYAEALRDSFPYELRIQGFAEGFRGFFHAGVQSKSLTVSTVEPFAELGGSLLGTSRPEELLGSDPRQRADCRRRIVDRCDHECIHILYVIGGDGSMRAAHALQRTADEMKKDLAVVGIPKTMDNDILWIWQSFGFLSAVEKAREVILNMHTEVASNPRLGIIQLFGSDSGFVASHAAYSTACDLVLIPEDPLTMEQIFRHVSKRLQRRLNDEKKSPYALVVMAETALPEDARNYIDDPDVHLSPREKAAVTMFLEQGRRVTGQTPDELRTAGLKMVSRLLQKRIRELRPPGPRGAVSPNQGSYWRDYRVVTNEPRHLIRSIRPSVSDVIFGERLGTLAVDNAMAGYRDFVVSQWLTEFVLVPLDLIVLGRKRVPIEGIFWKSVRAKTGQPMGTRTTAVVAAA